MSRIETFAGDGAARGTAAYRIAYLANDLTDATVQKRVAMLQAGGADVALAGYRRARAPVTVVRGVCPVDLGQTFDGRLVHRAFNSLLNATVLGGRLRFVEGVDVILARNLETLLVAAVARRRFATGAHLVYECLDIHSSMIGSGLRSRVLRWVERWLLDHVSLLVTSSPAFVSQYFTPFQVWTGKTLLVENKVLDLGRVDATPLVGPAGARDHASPPWRIGWFGVLRGQTALDTLCAVAEALPGQVEIVIRGRPSTNGFHDFEAQVDATPGVSFLGPYDPSDLPEMYADVHFSWALDLLDEAGNSAWLLPNRIYEGGIFGAVPICQIGTETGRWAKRHGLDLQVADPVADTIALIGAMTAERYTSQRVAAAAIPWRTFTCDLNECVRIVQTMADRPDPDDHEQK